MNKRKLPLKTAKNARDFTGIINKEGREIINPRFIRSDELSELLPFEKEMLGGQRRITKIIDLRTELEREERPDAHIHGVNNIHVPVFTESTMGITHEGALDRKKLLDSMPDMAELYRRMVSYDECIEKLKQAMQIIVNEEEGVLWHCTAGKDRCGMVSALFLTLLDVDRETIINDYLLTNRVSFLDAYGSGALVLFIYGSFSKAKKAKGLLSAERRFITSAFNAMEERCGSVDSFIRDILGVTDEQKQALKERCLR